MKQYITINQIKELNIIQLNKLVIALDISKYWQGAKMRTLQYEECVLQEIADTCSIGIMIEVLIDNIPRVDSIEDSLDIECDRTTKTFLVEYRTGNCSFKDYEGKELCDVLWDSVKNII